MMTDMETETDNIVSDILFNDSDDDMDITSSSNDNNDTNGGQQQQPQDGDFDASLHDAMKEAASFLDSDDDVDPPVAEAGAADVLASAGTLKDDDDDDDEEEDPFGHYDEDRDSKKIAIGDNEELLAVHQTLSTMTATQLCAHPKHAHSFAKASIFLTAVGLRQQVCAGCQQSLKQGGLFSRNSLNSSIADPSVVKCMACGALAHRTCAFQSNMEWKEMCPINGPSIQKAVSDGASEAVDDIPASKEGGDEYEMELNDNDASSPGVRKNCSFVSHCSSDQSMESQELEEDEMSFHGNDFVGNDPLNLDLADPDVAAAVTAAEEERIKAEADLISSPGGGREGKSPGAGRRVISKLLFANRDEKQVGNSKDALHSIVDNDDDGDGDHVAQKHEQEAGESAHTESEPKPEEGFEALEMVSPTSGKRRPWLRNAVEDNSQGSSKTGPAADSMPSWFTRKGDNDRADAAIDDDERHDEVSQEDKNGPLGILPRLPWMSAAANAVEEDYGHNADEPSDADEAVSSSVMEETDGPSIETEQRSGWFHRRKTPAVDTPAEEREAEEPSSPTPNLFSLFTRRSTQSDGIPKEGDEGNNEKTGQASILQDSHEAEFSQFLDVEEAAMNPGSPSRQEKELEKKGGGNDGIDITKNDASDQSAADGAEEGKPPTRGFGLFRRRVAAQKVHEEDTARGNEEVPTDYDKKRIICGPSVSASEETDVVDTNMNGNMLDNADEFQDMQDIRLETAQGSTDDQATPKPRFRLFSRNAESVSTNEGTPAVDVQVKEPVKAEIESPGSPVRRSLFSWKNNSQPCDEEVDLDKGANLEPNEDATTESREEVVGKPSADQRSLFSRVFTPLKAATDLEAETFGDEAEQEASISDANKETTPRRFSLFSTNEADVSPKGSTPVDVRATAPGQNEPVTPRRFSLFGFGRGDEDDEDQSETVAFELDKSWGSDAPPTHWKTATTPTFKGSPRTGEAVDGISENGNESDSAPLHYAKHPFASVSRALEDNILALLETSDEGEFSKIAEVEDTTDVPTTANENLRVTTPESSPRKPQSSLSLIVSPDSPDESEAANASPALGDIRPEPEQESTLLKVASGTYEAVKATALAQQKLGMASVAGGIAGGVAGLMFAGPAGALMGVRYGQTAGALGVVLEGSFTVGVIIAGVSGGRIAADKIQEQLEENRIITIGERGVTRKVMLVRPTIRIDPAWHDIWAEAQRSSPSSNAPIFSLFSTSDSIKQDRYEKTSDICDEEDIPTEEKVLLLVSRVLSDKGSFPGHVYRCLMKAFKDRCQERDELRNTLYKDKEDFPHLFDDNAEESVSMGDEVTVSLSLRARREDTHGVIKYITATLLEVRPGLASTAKITETTASVVEALVFGEVYDLVYEEIAIEATEKDKQLIERIDDFEFARVDRTGMPLCTEQVVSQEAIDALKRIPENHTAVDKLRHCVDFLEKISEHFATVSSSTAMGADSLLKMVCQHLVAAKMPGVNAEVAFLEEFARDQQLLRGKEGYALVTLQASLHFLNMSNDFERDIFGQDNDEENVPMAKASEAATKEVDDAINESTANASSPDYQRTKEEREVSRVENQETSQDGETADATEQGCLPLTEECGPVFKATVEGAPLAKK